MRYLKSLLWLAVLLGGAALADEPYLYVHSDDSPNFLLWLPDGYGESRQHYPLLLFLHGIGEKGDGSPEEIAKVAAHGPFRSMREEHWDTSLPLIVAAPQTGGLLPWWPRDAIVETLDHLQTHYRIDPRRIYLTGVSMGARAVWQVAEELPWRVAAIVPAGGWSGDLSDDCRDLQDLAVWAFHGEEDGLVFLRDGRKPVDTLHHCEPQPRLPVHLTVLDDVHHGSWELVYDNRHGDRLTGIDGRPYGDIYRWLLTFSIED